MSRSVLLTICAAVAIVLAILGISQRWDPVNVGLMLALSVSLLSIAMLDRALGRSRGREAELPEEERAVNLVDRTVIAAFGGLVTGIVFLLCYYLIDFSGATDISERHVDAICGYFGWQSFNPAPSLVQGSNDASIYPSLLQLLPEFVVTGAMIGLIVGYLVPAWRRFATRISRLWWALRWLKSIWGSYLAFGVLWGVTIGVVLNVFIFAKNDGRPFFSIYSAVLAACLSVLGYGLLETARITTSSSKRLNGRMAADIIGISLATLGAAVLYTMADRAFLLTQRSYCHFYAAWDTKVNRLRTTPDVLLVAGLYGAWIGLVVMSVAAAYSRIESAYARRRGPSLP